MIMSGTPDTVPRVVALQEIPPLISRCLSDIRGNNRGKNLARYLRAVADDLDYRFHRKGHPISVLASSVFFGMFGVEFVPP